MGMTMNPKDPELTREFIMERLAYNPETGEFKWKVNVNSHAKAGSVAGYVGVEGYRRINFKGKRIMAHRLAWLITYGEWPSAFVDHKDHDKLNNRISNLRLATKAQNTINTPHRRDNSVGARGVQYRKACTNRPYFATIKMDGKQRTLGYYATKEEAIAAYDAANRALNGEFAFRRRQTK